MTTTDPTQTTLQDLEQDISEDALLADVMGLVNNVNQAQDELAALGLKDFVPDACSKYKAVKSEALKADLKLAKTGTTFEALLKAKSRPYSDKQPLSNANPYYREITDLMGIEALLDELEAAQVIGYDIETTGLRHYRSDYILTHQFSLTPFTGVMFSEALISSNQAIRERLAKLLANPAIIKAIHNVKFEFGFLLKYYKIEIANYFDTEVAAHTINENRGIGLKDLAKQEFGLDMINFKEITRGSLAFDPRQTYALEYACADADLALQLYLKYAPDINRGGSSYEMSRCPIGYTREFYEIEMPLIKVLADMEQHGILINQGLLEAMSIEAEKNIADLRQQVIALSGMPELNPDSNQQLAVLVYEKLGLPCVSFTKQGAKSTAIKALELLKGAHPVIDVLIDYSHASQFVSLYTNKMPVHINALTGAIHTEIHQAGTVTARFSSSNPNLQNLRRNEK